MTSETLDNASSYLYKHGVHKPSTHQLSFNIFSANTLCYMLQEKNIEDVVMTCQKVSNVATKKVLALKDPLDFH